MDYSLGNFFWNNYHSSSLDDDLYEDGGTLTMNYCIYRAQSGATVNSNVGTSDPLFTDAANDDYSLSGSSPGLDAGSSTYAPATDINGVSLLFKLHHIFLPKYQKLQYANK